MSFIVAEVVNGVPLSLLSHPGLFSKRKLDLGTRVFLENIDIPDEGKVVDLGCGYGPIGIYLALANPRLEVFMLDSNPLAIRTSTSNVERYGLSQRVHVYRSDILSALDVDVEAIFSNPPLKGGTLFLEKMAEQASKKVKSNGYVEIVVYKGEENAIYYLSKWFSHVYVKKRVKGYSIIRSDK
ncbi:MULTISPECIES: class I SAM-dependent methyltransferase [Acidianus]|uniref:Methyltransferase n=1 Tax=Candidatus Acidianus copahuensis TaxID=1160895 RepID=A0A031LNH2_9CREN|nr:MULTISPECIES: methyltransferase [Acidianus]EZQ03094.1 methyltransferase [Candidatus Acidianus copahuensis]NON63556.1 methyltransferase [Acidianus sp. RZ1]